MKPRLMQNRRAVDVGSSRGIGDGVPAYTFVDTPAIATRWGMSPDDEKFHRSRLPITAPAFPGRNEGADDNGGQQPGVRSCDAMPMA